MSVEVDFEEKTIETKPTYTEGKYEKNKWTVERKYESCFYEMNGKLAITKEKEEQIKSSYVPGYTYSIQVTITKNTDMNVYIYAGENRFEATNPVIVGNEQA